MAFGLLQSAIVQQMAADNTALRARVAQLEVENARLTRALDELVQNALIEAQLAERGKKLTGKRGFYAVLQGGQP